MSPQTRFGGMTGERGSTAKSGELGFCIVANNCIATAVAVSHDAAESDFGSQSKCHYDYARRHNGSPDFDRQKAACYDIKSQHVDGSDPEKQENGDTGSQCGGDKETHNANPEEADCSAFTSNETHSRDETCSRQLTEQSRQNKAGFDGNTSLGRQRFDPRLQPDNYQMSNFLRRANRQVNIILPADPIPDIESSTDATSSSGSSNSNVSSSRASMDSTCSTSRDRNRSFEDTTESRPLLLLANHTRPDNNSVDHHDQSSFPGNDVHLENVNRFQKYSVHEQDRLPIVATCHLPALDIAGIKRDAIVDASSFEVVNDLPETRCVLPCIYDRHSIPEQAKTEFAIQEQSDLHPVTARNEDTTAAISHDKVIESRVALL